MITAADAKAQSEQVVQEQHAEAIGKIENAILLAVKDGKQCAKFYMPVGFPIDFMSAHLKALGYFVKTTEPYDQRDRPSLIINWN